MFPYNGKLFYLYFFILYYNIYILISFLGSKKGVKRELGS
jgi:hypothetical protein